MKFLFVDVECVKPADFVGVKECDLAEGMDGALRLKNADLKAFGDGRLRKESGSNGTSKSKPEDMRANSCRWTQA